MTSRPPCRECPWVRDTPPGQFPPARYEALRGTTGSPGREAPFGSAMFACHKAPEGEEFYCAGWMAAVGYENLTVRVLLARGKIPREAMEPGEDWPALHESYEALLAHHVLTKRRRKAP